MIERILEELERLEKFKWAPSLNLHNEIVKLKEMILNGFEEGKKEVEEDIEKIEKKIDDVIEIIEQKSSRKKKSDKEPLVDLSNYTPSVGINTVKDKETSK